MTTTTSTLSRSESVDALEGRQFARGFLIALAMAMPLWLIVVAAVLALL